MVDLAGASGWWVAAGALVALELVTGTFYLLMLALGLAAAALAAHAQLGFATQLMAAATVGFGSVTLWHLYRRRAASLRPSDPVALDVGEKVHVVAWEADGTTRVQYRGAAWTAIFEGAQAPESGPHTIKRLQGNRLVLGR